MKHPKSRTKRKIHVKTPGSRLTIHYKSRKPKGAHCNGCGVALTTVPRLVVSKLRQLPKTQRRPERPFGGMLCSICSRKKIKAQARALMK